MSLTAITSRSVRSSARRVKERPIRPKPLMPTLVVMLLPPHRCSREPACAPGRPASSANGHLTAGPMAHGGPDGCGARGTAQAARPRWKAPDGQVRTGELLVTADVAAGCGGARG